MNQLSVLEILSQAGGMVLFVLFVLLLASFGSWYLIVERILNLRLQRNANSGFENEFWSGRSWPELVTMVGSGSASRMFARGYITASRALAEKQEVDIVMARVKRAMGSEVQLAEESLVRWLPVLATVSSTAPYVGLFGTVWGIMRAFAGLANNSQATIAAVAPGISEALIATAMGLVAAIPAGIAFNLLRSGSESEIVRTTTFCQEAYSQIDRAVRRGDEFPAVKQAEEAPANDAKKAASTEK